MYKRVITNFRVFNKMNFIESLWKRVLHEKQILNNKMDDISKIWAGPLPTDSPYLKPLRLYYIQSGVEKNRDLMKAHDSVSIIIFNKTRQNLVFVKQFRPAVYYGIVSSNGMKLENINLKKYPPSLGITLELCAGMIDKEKSWIEIAREEILEECGYDVDIKGIEEVLTYRSAVGSQGTTEKMYYCEVTDDDKTAPGGGVDDELIEVVEYSIDEARKLVQQGAINNSPASCLMGVLWFLANKAPKVDGKKAKINQSPS